MSTLKYYMITQSNVEKIKQQWKASSDDIIKLDITFIGVNVYTTGLIVNMRNLEEIRIGSIARAESLESFIINCPKLKSVFIDNMLCNRMSSVVWYCKELERITINNLPYLTHLGFNEFGMIRDCGNIKSIELGNLPNLKLMRNEFRGCVNLNTLKLINVPKTASMSVSPDFPQNVRIIFDKKGIIVYDSWPYNEANYYGQPQ